MKVFIVDDDAAERLTAVAALDAPDFNVSEYADATTMLAAIEQEMPDLILLDIEMPGMDGVSACRTLRATGDADLQVIFISAHNDLETRLLAYEAGGDDFIVKPYKLEELAHKARAIRQYADQLRDLATQAQDAQRTAFTVMSAMAETGVVLEYLRAFFACETPEALAAKLLEALRQFELEALVELRTASGRNCHASRGICSPLECSILEHAAGMDRIFQFRDRLAINYPGVTLIALALPLADSERIGRLRDHLAILAEGADARLQAMEVARRQQTQTQGIADAIIDLTRTLEEIDRLSAAHRLRAAEIDEAYLAELIDAFVHLGLTEDQELTLADMAQRTHTKLAELRDEDSDVGDQLRSVARKLERLAKA